MKKNNKKAFTIVELVIVIGVIGILSAILIPTFTNLTNSARQAGLKSDLAAVYSSYAADVADGYYGEAGVAKNAAVKMYAQEEVALSKDATKFYTYDAANGGWQTTGESKVISGDDQNAWLLEGTGDNHEVAEYNGYRVYRLVA